MWRIYFFPWSCVAERARDGRGIIKAILTAEIQEIYHFRLRPLARRGTRPSIGVPFTTNSKGPRLTVAQLIISRIVGRIDPADSEKQSDNERARLCTSLRVSPFTGKGCTLLGGSLSDRPLAVSVNLADALFFWVTR